MADPQFLYLLFLILYFLPSFVAVASGHRNGGAIFLLNLFLGWTVLGWIGAVVWAVRSPSNRREHPRFRVPSDVPLRCIPVGVASFEAQIVDISRGGIGGMIYPASVKLPPNTVLKGCRLVIPGGEAIVVDLEVRNTRSIVQPDGSLAQLSGVRFLDEPKGIDALLKKFVIEFDEDCEAP
jgi:hypothetical protein